MRTRLVAMVASAAVVVAAPVALAQSPVEMVMTNELATTHWKTAYMEEVAADIEKRCPGKIDVKLYHAGQLYKDREAVAAIGTGSVHMVWPVSVQLDSINPRYGIVDQPFVLSDAMMLKPEARKELATWLSSLVSEQGLEVMGLMRASELMFLFPDMVVAKPDDLDGQKIRVTGGKVLQDVMRKLGASPITMPASEMTTALALGAIDGIFTSAGGWEMVGNNAKDASMVPGLSLLTYSVVVDKEWLEGLDPELQTCVHGAVDDMLAGQWQRAIDDDKKALDNMLAKGGEYSTVSDEELAKFKATAEESRQQFYDEYPDVAAKFKEIVNKYQ